MVWVVAAAFLVLWVPAIVWSAYARMRKRMLSELDGASFKKRRVFAARRTTIRNRMISGAAASVVLGVGLYLLAPGVPASGPAPDEDVPATGTQGDQRFPIEFLTARADGEVVVEIGNDSPRDRYLQCYIEPLGDRGELLTEREYSAYDREGEEITTDSYANTVFVAAGEELRLEAGIPVEGPVARWEGRCEGIPDVQTEEIESTP